MSDAELRRAQCDAGASDCQAELSEGVKNECAPYSDREEVDMRSISRKRKYWIEACAVSKFWHRQRGEAENFDGEAENSGGFQGKTAQDH
jgi:hypothetical protein